MAHHSQRLSFGRLAEHLADGGKVDPELVKSLLDASRAGGQPLPLALVEGNYMSDWDLAKEVAEIFHLAFVPVEVAKPNVDLLLQFDGDFLREHNLVPIARFGDLVTVIMPGIVQADTLGTLAALTDLNIQPVVGTVLGNQAWLAKHLKKESEENSEGWGSLFDEGDAAVKAALDPGQGAIAEEPPGPLPGASEIQAGPSMAQLLGEGDLDLPPEPRFEEQQHNPPEA